VIQIQNNYDREVFNGDAGYVVSVDPQAKTMVVEFPETDYKKIQDGTPLSLLMKAPCRIEFRIVYNGCSKLWFVVLLVESLE
jgi:hypothetical protein